MLPELNQYTAMYFLRGLTDTTSPRFTTKVLPKLGLHVEWLVMLYSRPM